MVRVTAWNKKVRIHSDELDLENMIFNCANGSIDLSCGRLVKHERSNRITKISPVDYQQSADCPVWEGFLNSIFKKNKVLIMFVQKVLGMSLTGDVSAQSMFILY